MALVAGFAACGDEFTSGANPGGGGASATSTGTSTVAGSGGSGGSTTGLLPCTPSEMGPCYEGAPGTEAEGVCRLGQGVCNQAGDGWESCDGQILPLSESCLTPFDENCDGAIDEHCAEWGVHIPVGAYQDPSALALGPDGDIAIGGLLRGVVEFAPGDELDCSAGSGNWAYVARLAADGAKKWARCLGGFDQYAQVDSLSFDAAGDVYISGNYRGTIDFGGFTEGSAGEENGFFAKLSGADGATAWYEVWGANATSNYDAAGGEAALVDPDGNPVFVLDYPGAPISVGGLSLGNLGTQRHISVMELDAAGAVRWNREIGGTHFLSEPRAALEPSGDVILATSFWGNPTIGGTPIGMPGAQSDLALLRFADDTGDPSVVAELAAPGQLRSRSVVANGTHIAVTGWFTGEFDAGDGPVDPPGDTDGFVAVFDAVSGAHLWSRIVASSESGTDQRIHQAAFGPDGELYIVAGLEGQLEIDGELLVPGASVPDSNPILLKLAAATGSVQWHRYFVAADDADFGALAFEADDRLLVFGDAEGPIDLGVLTPSEDGLFLLRLDP
jgi:hypothetical protein